MLISTLPKCVFASLLVLACNAFAINVAQAAEVNVRTPENATVAWISNEINQDGMLLSIKTFDSPDSIGEVMDYYRRIWFKEGEIPGFVENTMGEWTLISQLRENHNIVLQLKPSPKGGSTGFLSSARKSGSNGPVNLDFPIPDQTEKFSSTYLEENDNEVLTMTFVSNLSIGHAASFYRDELKKKGWILSNNKKMYGNQVMMFSKRGDKCELVIGDLGSDATVIYVNRVRRNG